MGKASSNKKVARAAGTGGGRSGGARRPWNFYGVLALVIVLGLVFTVTSRERRSNQINNAGAVAPTVGTVWDEGYAVDICGKFVAPIQHAKDPEGITTGTPSGQKVNPAMNGIIKIAPTVKAAAGANATLGKFASAVGMKLNAAELQVPGGKLYEDGDTCSGTPSHVYVQEFNTTADTIGTLSKLDPSNVKLEQQSMLTIAFLPASKKDAIPPPPAYVITNLKALAAAASPASTTTTTVAPAVKPGSTATTVAGSPPTTVAGSPATTKPATSPTTARATTATT